MKWDLGHYESYLVDDPRGELDSLKPDVLRPTTQFLVLPDKIHPDFYKGLCRFQENFVDSKKNGALLQRPD